MSTIETRGKITEIFEQEAQGGGGASRPLTRGATTA